MAQLLTPEELQRLLEPVLLEINPAVYLVEVRQPSRSRLQLLVDTDQGLHLKESVNLNRGLRRLLEEQPDHPLQVLEKLELEISSPGLGEPIRLNRQYNRHVGRSLRLQLADGQELFGKLLEVQPQGLLLLADLPDPQKPKRKTPQQTPVPFDQIHKAQVEAVL